MRRFVAIVSCLVVVMAGWLALPAVAPAVSQPAQPVRAAGSFQPVTSVRVLDTRTSGGLAPARVARFAVGGRGPIPADAAAVVVNVSIVLPGRTGSVSVFPGGTTWNGAASVSFVAGSTKQSMITAKLGSDGSLALRNNVAVTIEAIADVAGYYAGGTPTADGTFTAIGFQRVFDTRAAGSHPLPAGSATTVQIADRGAIPFFRVGGVVANLTVLNPARTGSVSIFGTRWDHSASESFTAGRTEQDVLTIKLGSNGAAVIRNNTGVPLSVVLDVIGYFWDGYTGVYGSYFPSDAGLRVFDGRSAGPMRSGAQVLVQPSWVRRGIGSGVPLWGTPAILVRITVLNPAHAGSISVFRVDQHWNGSSSISFPAGGSTQQQLVAPTGPDNRLFIRNNSAAALTLILDVLGAYLGAPASPKYIGDVGGYIDPPRGQLVDVSCPMAAFCMAVQQHGYLETWNGSTWSAPSPLIPLEQAPRLDPVYSVSCVSATFCLAAGQVQPDRVDVFRFDGSHWTSENRDLAWTGHPPQVSCVSTSFCMVDLVTGYYTFNGIGGWSDYQAIGAHLWFHVSCTSASFCMTVNDLGQIYTYRGSGWAASTIPGLPATAVACTSSTFCVAVGGTKAALFDGSAWTVTGTLESGHTLQSVACSSSTDCFALDTAGSVLRYDGHSWSGPVVVNSDAQHGVISCSAAGTCAVINTSTTSKRASAATFDGTNWSAVQLVDVVPGSLDGVSCSSASFCTAVDTSGYAWHYDGANWSTAQVTGGVALRGVSCTASNCVAVDDSGNARSYDGSTWSSPVAVDPGQQLTAVSCASSTFCAAVGADGKAATFNGTGWTTPTTVSARPLRVLSCASATFCRVIDDQGATATYDGTSWVAGPHSLVTSTSSLSCPTATWCMETGYNGAAQWNGGTPTFLAIPYQRDLLAMSCSSSQMCMGLETGGVAGGLHDYLGVGWDGTEWTNPIAEAGPNSPTPAVSCPTSSFCLAVEGSAAFDFDDIGCTTCQAVHGATAIRPDAVRSGG
jgi:hypothetical protein